MFIQLFFKWLRNPIYFRYGFFAIVIISAVLSNLFHYGNGYYYIFYIISVVCLGIGYYNKPPWVLFLFTLFVVICRFHFVQESQTILIFFIHLLTYSIITAISAGFMIYVQKVKADNLELTTALANALDSRDPYTKNHSENVSKYCVQIAEKMKLPRESLDILRKGALLHDIGKIGIPEHILMKNSRLTDEEYEIIKCHPAIGYNMIKHVGDFLHNGVLDIVLYHHERFDGKGYPYGLKGKEIPLFARIVAVADTFDAMTTKRVYRDEIALEVTLNEIKKSKGTQFDPDIVDVLLSLFEEKDV